MIRNSKTLATTAAAAALVSAIGLAYAQGDITQATPVDSAASAAVADNNTSAMPMRTDTNSTTSMDTTTPTTPDTAYTSPAPAEDTTLTERAPQADRN